MIIVPKKNINLKQEQLKKLIFSSDSLLKETYSYSKKGDCPCPCKGIVKSGLYVTFSPIA